MPADFLPISTQAAAHLFLSTAQSAAVSHSYFQRGLPQPLQLAPFSSIASLWFLMILGILSMFYAIYSRRDWVLLLPLLWVLMSIQTVYYMVRLVFFLGPPIALVSGYFLSDALRRLSELSFVRAKEGIGKVNLVTLPVVAILAVIIFASLATGYAFCSSVGPSFNQYWKDADDPNYTLIEIQVKNIEYSRPGTYEIERFTLA